MESQRGRKQENFMVIVMQEGASEAQIQHVIDRLVAHGFNVHRSTGESHTVLGAVGLHRDFDHRDFELLDGVREVMRITQPFKLDRKSTRLNSSHGYISYAVFCLKKKNFTDSAAHQTSRISTETV